MSCDSIYTYDTLIRERFSLGTFWLGDVLTGKALNLHLVGMLCGSKLATLQQYVTQSVKLGRRSLLILLGW